MPPARGAGVELGVRVVEIDEGHLPGPVHRAALARLLPLHHEVVGLDVAVQHALRVHVAYGLQDVPGQLLHGRLRHHTVSELTCQAGQEGATRGPLHDDVVVVVVLQHLVQGQHASVRREVQEALLALPEHLRDAVPDQRLLGADLHHVLPAQEPAGDILGLADDDLAAVALLLQHLVPGVEVKNLLAFRQLLDSFPVHWRHQHRHLR
mmetsp:Transcript_62491/g.201560  ORF Transcript_62491/g.201560 Transcript_62491/m.201560 type:complete len:208 (-) Transcript_62491:402-1025(-)